MNQDLEALEVAHKVATYGTPEGHVPTVSSYKYLGITIDECLGDLRKGIVGEQSMELNFIMLQAKKGMRQLHMLWLFLMDHFCKCFTSKLSISV